MLKKLKRNIYPVSYFIKAYPSRTIFIVAALMLSGLAEAVSFAALIPLLGMALLEDNVREDFGLLEQLVSGVLGFLGLDATIGGVLVLVVCLMCLKSYLSFYAMKEVGYICADVEVDFRKEIVDSLLYAEWHYFLSNQTGDFSTAISTQVQLAANVFRATGLVAAGLIQVGFFTAMSLTISVPISVGGVVLGLIVMLLLRNFVTLAQVSSKTLARHEGTLLSTLIDGLRGMKSNKAMGMQGRLQSYLERDIEQLAVMRKRILFSSAVLKNFQEPIQVIGIAAALYILSTYWQGGVEELLVLIMLFYRTGQNIANMLIYYQQIATAIPPFWFVLNVINSAKGAKEDLDYGEDAFHGESIEFSGVGFSYGEKVILRNVDFKICAGEFVTIVGPSGGGKTTLTDMLLAFNTPEVGTVRIDGKDISKLSRASLREMIGYVPQETVLFHDSLRNNLTFGDEQINDAKLEDALSRAGAMAFVKHLSGGLDFVVGEHGGRLSGGQKQRIGLARALLHSPRILLLDEPTSSLDKKSEDDILKTLNELRGSVTIVAISHQQTFANASDRKFLLREGALFEITN